MNGEILRGFTDAIILNCLLISDSYGYKISKYINELTNNLINITNTTIYLAFKRMEKDKLIESYWSDNLDSVRRKYYKITKEGKKYLNNKKEEWLRNRDILNNLLGDLNER